MSQHISQVILVSTGILNIDSDSCVVSRRTCKKVSVRGGNSHSLLTVNCLDPLNLLQGITLSFQISDAPESSIIKFPILIVQV